jgi:hypothetical protein
MNAMMKMIPVYEQRTVETSFARSLQDFESLKPTLEEQGFKVRAYATGMCMYLGTFKDYDCQIYLDNLELHLDGGLNFQGKRYSTVEAQSQAVLGGLVSVPESASDLAEERRKSLIGLLNKVAEKLEA